MKYIVGLVCAALLTGFVVKAADEAAPAKAKSCFACVDCKAASMTAGKCACGKDMKAMNCVSVKDGVATCCACDAGCKCEVKEGEAKCACGKDAVKCKMAAEKKAESAK